MGKTKKDYEEAINTVLETDIEWSRLKKDDLVEFATILSEPEVITKRLGIESEPSEKQRIGGRVMNASKYLLDELNGPGARFLKSLLEEENE